MKRALLAALLAATTSGLRAEEPAPATSGKEPPREPGGFIPRIAVYVPEGEAEIRLSKFVKSSLFETEFEYDFVSGDIAAYLRYKYYGSRQSLSITAFDRVSFAALESLSLGYDRVRGLSAFVRRPVGLYGRATFLAELDRFDVSKPDDPVESADDGLSNLFTKVGFQWGTEDDNFGNRISGDPNDRARNLFTVARNFSPGGRGFSIGVTWGIPVQDYNYVRVEAEGIQSIDVGRTRVVGRLHAGFFPHKPEGSPDDSLPGLLFQIPAKEYFTLGGRDALKGLREPPFGTDEIHLTLETFIPLFVDRNAEFLKASWDTLYLVAYGGTGNAGVGRDVYTSLGDYRYDAGLGFEVSFQIFRYRVFASVLAAQEVGGGSASPRFLMTLRSVN